MQTTSHTLAQFRDEIRQATRKAVDESFDYTKSLLDDITAEVTAKLDAKLKSYETPPPLKVKVGERPEVKLKKPASPVLDKLILHSQLGFNTLLVGPAGCGKTMAAEQLAESLEMPFGHLNLTAGASETWLFGRQTPGGFKEGQFSKFYRDGGVFLADEMDAADPNLLLAINTALAGHQMANPISGEIIERHVDFVFVGAANTFGKGSDEVYTGRSRLDAATLDRFIVVEMTYCSTIEKQVCPDETLRKLMHDIRARVESAKSKEVVSTRALDRAFKLLQSGVSLIEIIQSLTFGWPEELRNDALDLAKSASKAPKKSKAKALPAPTNPEFEIPSGLASDTGVV